MGQECFRCRCKLNDLTVCHYYTGDSFHGQACCAQCLFVLRGAFEHERPMFRVKRLDPGLPMPKYQTDGAAGLDLYSAENTCVAAHSRKAIRTGLAVEIPTGYVGLLCPRSGWARKYGITFVNSPGVIDSDYRGEVTPIFLNLGQHAEASPFWINRGDRIGQLVLVPCPQFDVVEAAYLTDTERGTGGFGSTGVSDPTTTPNSDPML